jgi:hypothetical protein
MKPQILPGQATIKAVFTVITPPKPAVSSTTGTVALSPEEWKKLPPSRPLARQSGRLPKRS